MGGAKGLGDLLPALPRLERLGLKNTWYTPELWGALQQLTGLTALGICYLVTNANSSCGQCWHAARAW